MDHAIGEQRDAADPECTCTVSDLGERAGAERHARCVDRERRLAAGGDRLEVRARHRAERLYQPPTRGSGGDSAGRAAARSACLLVSGRMIYDDICQTIGRTPVVRINRLAPKHVTMYVKVESFNPGGSVKDRLALGIIEDAERRGALRPGQTVVEATSGNTGIALAMVCAARGYPFVALMADSFSVERRQVMRAYGAKVILTPAAERGTGMVRRAEELAAK